MNINLIHGDCLQKMREIPDADIDLTVTSPPYDNMRIYDGSLVWNESIWKDVLNELYRITKSGGVVVWVVGDATIKGSETGTSFKQALYAKEIGFSLNDTMIYQKYGSGMPHNSHRYGQSFEYMFILSKGVPTSGKIATFLKTGKTAKTTRRGRDGIIRKGEYNIGGGKLSNVWKYSNGGRRSLHPATFPEQLAKDHILSWSNPDGIVFDPFMGSGTTGVACKKLNRNFIGVEINKDYFAIAENRLNSLEEKQNDN